jgi:hypothetical protein
MHQCKAIKGRKNNYLKQLEEEKRGRGENDAT